MERIGAAELAAGLPAHLRGGALALGNFDGVHIGHQAVIRAALDHARAAGKPALVATFDPHPSLLFRPDSPPFALTPAAQKLDVLAGLGLDAAVSIPFNAEIAGLSADDFARKWLAEKLGISHVVTGEDFCFGKARSGHAADLARLGADLGFTAQAVAPIEAGGDQVSSTRIRTDLREGRPRDAARLLSRPFTIRAVVEQGAQLGRTIGTPTANQKLGNYLRPRYGVYAVRVRLPDGDVRPGVANLGIRPMFTPPVELLESWIFDWAGNLYGQQIDVELVEWLRPELDLGGITALKAQIARDAEDAKAALARE